MGYTTEFVGQFELNKELSRADYTWLSDFASEDHRNEQGVPGFYCQWVPTEDGKHIEWDGNEKFYEYTEWLKWLIKNFFEPKGYILNGKVRYQGEEVGDTGYIIVADNKVSAKELKEDETTVVIKSITYDDGYDIREKTVVEIDGEQIGGGYYGGEPEDNFRFRDYGWVETLISVLAKRLGAKVEVQNIDGEEAKKLI